MRGDIGLLSSGVTGLSGALDGVVVHADAKAARTPFTKQWSTYLEAGYAVGGALLSMFGFSSDIAMPLYHGGLYELARKGGFFAVAQWGGQGAPVAYPYAAGMRALPMAEFGGGGFGEAHAFGPRRQPVGDFG